MMKLRPEFAALLMASKKAKANNGNKPKEQPKTTSK